MDPIKATKFTDNDLENSLSSIDDHYEIQNGDDLCRIRQNPLIDSAMFKAYELLRKTAVEQGLESELAVPRIVFVGDTSSGKSILVQMFLRFPCTFSHANVGTRCPVQYKLRYDPNLADDQIHFIQPKGWRAEDLGKNLQLEMARIEHDHKKEGGFRLKPFVVEIASKHYTDFEILDVPGLVSGDRDASKREAVERITEYYVRDPSFMIVQLKEAQQLPDNTYGTRRIEELCTAEPAVWGSKFPARKDYAQHTITIQTKFDAFMDQHDNGTTTNEDICIRIDLFPDTYFTNTIFDLYNFADHTYEENVQYIAQVPEMEKKQVEDWITRINAKAAIGEHRYQLFNQKYRPLIGIHVVRQQIQELWLRAFRVALPRLRGAIDKLINDFSSKFDTSLVNLEQQNPTSVRKNYQKYIETFRTTISDYAAYRAEVNALFPLEEYGRTYEDVEKEYNNWNRKQSLTWRAYLSAEELKQVTGERAIATLNLRYVGARHFERLRQVFSYMVLSYNASNHERDWFESSQSLLYGGTSDYENTEKAVRESLFTLVRETFLVGICWLTQMYTFLTDHFSTHVKLALLNTKFSHLQQHVKFLSLVDLEYHTVTRKFIQNAITSIKQARYAKMVYAVHNVSDALKNLVGSFSSPPMTIRNDDDGNDDSGNDTENTRKSGRLMQTVLEIAQDAVPKMMMGSNPRAAITSSAMSVLNEGKNPLDLIYSTGKFLTNDRNPQTVNYLPQTRSKVVELYSAVRGQLLHDITTNFFANLVLEIQQYKSISVENSLQNRLMRMSDTEIARMANIEIEISRQEALGAHEKIKQLEQARDAIEHAILLMNNKNIQANGLNANDDKNKRIREAHAHTRSKRLQGIERKLRTPQQHKKRDGQTTNYRSSDQASTYNVVNEEKFSNESDTDYDNDEDENTEVEDEHELMQYDDKTLSDSYLLGIFRNHDREDLELGFLTGDSLNADEKFVQERQRQQQQQQQSLSSVNLPTNMRTTEHSVEHTSLSCPPESNLRSIPDEITSSTISADQVDHTSVVDTTAAENNI